MSEVPLYGSGRNGSNLILRRASSALVPENWSLQGYLAHKKYPSRR